MKNSPKKPGQDHVSPTPARTDKRDPSQPPARRDQPQGYQDQDQNKRGQEPRREDELPLKKDRQPVAKSTQREPTEPREKGQSTGANKSTNVNKKAQTPDMDASDEEYLREDEDIDDVNYGDDDSDVDDDEK